MIWQLTVPEIEGVLELKIEDDRAAALHAGLIAATIINVNQKRGSRMVQPRDFFRMPDDYLTPEAAVAFMDSWAVSQGGAIVAPTDAEVKLFSGGGPDGH